MGLHKAKQSDTAGTPALGTCPRSDGRAGQAGRLKVAFRPIPVRMIA